MKKITLNKKKIADFCHKYHIAFLGLFGSVLTERFVESSDVDVLVQFKKKHIPHIFAFVNMESELSSIMGRRVDLKTPNELSHYFREEVLAAAKVIYAA